MCSGLCKVATLAEIEAQGWSLNPGRYVGVAERAADDFEFAVRLEELNEELETLNAEARELEERIAENVAATSGGERYDCIRHENCSGRDGDSDRLRGKTPVNRPVALDSFSGRGYRRRKRSYPMADHDVHSGGCTTKRWTEARLTRDNRDILLTTEALVESC